MTSQRTHGEFSGGKAGDGWDSRMGSLFARAILVSMAAVFSVAGPARATQVTSEERAAAYARPAIVYLEMVWQAWVKHPQWGWTDPDPATEGAQAWQWSSRCSGFVINPSGHIVTAGHCVDNGTEGARDDAIRFAAQWLIEQTFTPYTAEDYEALITEGHATWRVEGEERDSPPDLTVYVQRGVATSGLTGGDAFPARVIDFSPVSQGDVALLKAERTDLPAVKLAPREEIQIGTPVLSIGYPGATDEIEDITLEPTYKDGKVSSKDTREGGLFPVYEISADISSGMSGGPTVDLKGRVVGLNSLSLAKGTGEAETAGFNYLAPSSLIDELLGRNGVQNALGPTDQAYRAGLESFFAGDYQAAIAKFDEVLALAPAHQQAQEWKQRATKAAASAPQGGGVSVPLIAGGVGVLLLMLGGGFLLVRRQRKPVPVAAGAPLATRPEGAAEPFPPRAEPEEARMLETAPVGFKPRAASTTQASQEGTLHRKDGETPTPGLRAESRRFCRDCGTPYAPGARFCESCGNKLV